MRKSIALILILLVCISATASASGIIGASVHVRASRSVYDSVIQAGEDVDLFVEISNFTPSGYVWYREGILIEGEHSHTCRIEAAQVEDSGIYRMDAIDASGKVRVSAEVALRVVDQTIPKTGDGRPAPVLLMGAMASAAAGLIISCKKKVHNQQKVS